MVVVVVHGVGKLVDFFLVGFALNLGTAAAACTCFELRSVPSPEEGHQRMCDSFPVSQHLNCSKRDFR